MRQQLNTDKIFPKKSLGQNFIVNESFILNMNDFINSTKNNTLVEIGPGRGALTKYLSKKTIENYTLLKKMII